MRFRSLSILAFLASVSAIASAPPALTGKVVRPGDAEFEASRKGFAAHAQYAGNEPSAIVYATSDADVVNAIQYARANGLKIRPRGGGHSYEGYSSLAKGGIVIDVSAMKSFRMNRKKTEATIGAGIKMFDLYEHLGSNGVNIPLATGPTVGLAGLTLGGGAGITSRKWGLTADNLLSMRVAMPNGRIITASRKKYPDLFWALSGGGGGNVGVVLDFTFKLHPIGNVAVFEIIYPWAAFEPVVKAWQEWAPKAHRGFTSVLAMVTKEGDTEGEIQIYGQFTPDSDAELAKVQELLAPVLTAHPPKKVDVQPLPPLYAGRVILGQDPMDPMKTLPNYRKNQLFKSTSTFAMRLMTPEEIKALRITMEGVPKLRARPSQPSMIQFLSGGGAIAAPVGTSPSPYRNTKFIIQLDGYWTAPEDAEPTRQWVKRLREQTLEHGYGKGAYVNYIDSQIPNFNEVAFGKQSLAKLRAVKRRYDPENLFNTGQGWLEP